MKRLFVFVFVLASLVSFSTFAQQQEETKTQLVERLSIKYKDIVLPLLENYLERVKQETKKGVDKETLDWNILKEKREDFKEAFAMSFNYYNATKNELNHPDIFIYIVNRKEIDGEKGYFVDFYDVNTYYLTHTFLLSFDNEEIVDDTKVSTGTYKILERVTPESSNQDVHVTYEGPMMLSRKIIEIDGERKLLFSIVIDGVYHHSIEMFPFQMN